MRCKECDYVVYGSGASICPNCDAPLFEEENISEERDEKFNALALEKKDPAFYAI